MLARFLIIYSTFICSFVLGGTKPEGLEFLKGNSKKDGVIETASGLQFKYLREGDGEFHPTIDSSCECHYEGKLLDGTVFDSSYQRGTTTSFAPNQVIKGWTEMMQLMVEGDKVEIYIKSELGYGDRGSPPKIQGGDVLIFIMEIKKILGDTVPADKCNPETKDKCSHKEINFIEKAKTKFDTNDKINNEIKRLQSMDKSKIKDDLVTWITKRIKILTKLVKE